MTALKAHEVARFLTRPDVREGVFLAYGPDAGLVRETAQRLIAFLAGTGPNAAEIVTFDGSELDADPSKLAIEAKTGSLFGDRRVLRVRGAGKSLVLTLAEFTAEPVGTAIVNTIPAANITSGGASLLQNNPPTSSSNAVARLTIAKANAG